MKDDIYYTFPADLMIGYWKSEEEKQRCLCRVLSYCAFKAWKNRERGTPDGEFYDLVCKELGLVRFIYKNKSQFYENTNGVRELYYNYEGLYWSVSRSLFFKHYNSEETDVERIGFLAYLAAKSILGNRGFAKTNRNFITSRMACNLRNVSDEELPEQILMYRKRYHFDKLCKEILPSKYKVAVYSDNRMRGVYLSLRKNADGEPDLLWLAEQVANLRIDKKKGNDPYRIMLLEARRKVEQMTTTPNNTTTTPNDT